MLQQLGGYPGARAHVSYLPGRGVGVAAFVNDSSAAAELTDAIANYVYDRTANRSDARPLFDARLDALVAGRDRYYAAIRADRVKRAKRSWMLARPVEGYAGRYENEDFGSIDISADGGRLAARFGVMHAIAEPYVKPETIRVELLPQSGEVIHFGEGEGRPATLDYDGATYRRV
jgi:hypothetical protein